MTKEDIEKIVFDYLKDNLSIKTVLFNYNEKEVRVSNSLILDGIYISEDSDND